MLANILIYFRSKRSIYRAYRRHEGEIRHLTAMNQAHKIDMDNQRDLIRRIRHDLELLTERNETYRTGIGRLELQLISARADISAWCRTAEQWRMRAARLEADNQVLATQSLNLATTLHATGVMEWDPLTTAVIEATQVQGELEGDGLTQIFDELTEVTRANTEAIEIITEEDGS